MCDDARHDIRESTENTGFRCLVERVGIIDKKGETQLLAGFARRDITPDDSLPMGGYIERAGSATGKHGPLLAKAAAFRYGRSAAVLLVLDLLCVSHIWVSRLRNEISRKVGLPQNNILISATHTHSGPAVFFSMTGSDAQVHEYEENLLRWCSQTVESASASMNPVRLRAGAATVDDIGANRRDKTKAVDHTLSVVRIENLSGEAVGHLASFSCHPTVMGPSNLEYSADLFGEAAGEVEKAFHDSECLLFCGAAADVSTRFVRREQTWTELERLGKKLGEKIISVSRDAQPIESAGINARSTAMTIPFREIPDPLRAQSEYDEALGRIAENAGESENRLARSLVEGAAARLFLSRLGGWRSIFGSDEAELELQVIRIGDIVICALPGEFFAARAKELLEAARPKFGFVAGCTNGYWGYFVPPDEAARGGYETMMSAVEPQNEPGIIEAARKLMRDIGRDSFQGRKQRGV